MREPSRLYPYERARQTRLSGDTQKFFCRSPQACHYFVRGWLDAFIATTDHLTQPENRDWLMGPRLKKTSEYNVLQKNLVNSGSLLCRCS